MMTVSFRTLLSAGLCQPDETKRWSYLSSFDSCSDISADITNQEAALVSHMTSIGSDPGWV